MYVQVKEVSVSGVHVNWCGQNKHTYTYRDFDFVMSYGPITVIDSDSIIYVVISWYALAQVFHRKFRRFGDYTATFISEWLNTTLRPYK